MRSNFFNDTPYLYLSFHTAESTDREKQEVLPYVTQAYKDSEVKVIIHDTDLSPEMIIRVSKPVLLVGSAPRDFFEATNAVLSRFEDMSAHFTQVNEDNELRSP